MLEVDKSKPVVISSLDLDIAHWFHVDNSPVWGEELVEQAALAGGLREIPDVDAVLAVLATRGCGYWGGMDMGGWVDMGRRMDMGARRYGVGHVGRRIVGRRIVGWWLVPWYHSPSHLAWMRGQGGHRLGAVGGTNRRICPRVVVGVG